MGYLLGIGFCLICGIAKFAHGLRPRRGREAGFPMIYVEDDGSARELDADERAYLEEEFEPGDGGRPYIKFNYETLTPDQRISGFLSRRQLPKHIVIKPATD